MKYIIYCTINLVNGKVYVGIHKTFTPDKFDGYLGCGVYTNGTGTRKNTVFQRAVKKYGADNFKRITLAVFDNELDALLMEKTIVTKEFVKSKSTYNSTVGGKFKSYDMPIYRYTVDKGCIKSYDTINDAAKEQNVLPVTLYKAAMKQNITVNGYIWRFYESSSIHIPTTLKEIAKRGRPVVQYSKAGYKMKTWKSAKEAAHKLHIDRATITAACRGKKRTVGGYQWRYLSDDIEILPKIETAGGKQRKIIQLDKEGRFITSYESITDAAEHVDLSRSSIHKGLKTGKFVGGYFWKYI